MNCRMFLVGERMRSKPSKRSKRVFPNEAGTPLLELVRPQSAMAEDLGTLEALDLTHVLCEDRCGYV